MQTIDLRDDARVLRRELESFVAALVSEKSTILSAIEIGYDCDQGGWIFIHADRCAVHNRDGSGTNGIDDGDGPIRMRHWIEAMEASFEGEDVQVTKRDGSTFLIAGFDEGEDTEEDASEEYPLTVAIGEMILDVLMTAKGDGIFLPLAKFGAVQLDIEDFNGVWAWPEYDDLGKTNLA